MKNQEFVNEKIEIDGIVYWYKPMIISEKAERKWRRGEKLDHEIYPICKMCHNEVLAKEFVYLLINNYKSFPNCWVHSKCFHNWTPEQVMKMLKSDYEIAKRSKHWFR